jgi:hypothetical protein
MTIYKTVVSWLAFLFFAYVVIKRSSQLSWRWFLGQLDSVDPERWDSWIPVRGETLGTLDDIWYALFWTLLGLMLVTPWLRPWWSNRRKSARPISFDDPLSSWLNLAGRWVCAVIYLDHLFLWLPFHPSFFMRQLHPDYFYTQNAGDYFANAIRPVILGVGTTLLIAPELTQFASSGFTRFIDAVFFPGGREAKPPYTLKLARFYVEKQRWEEAEAEYARMLSFYPDQPEAWQERLTLAFRRRDAPAGSTPERVLAEALKVLKTPTDREAVYQQFTRGRPV